MSRSVGLDHVPARNHVAGCELFEDHAGQRTHVQGIEPGPGGGLGHGVLLGFAHGIGMGPQNATRSGDTGAGRFRQAAVLLQASENATHHGSGNWQLLAAQKNGQLVLAPAEKLQTQRQNLFLQGKRPSRLPLADGDDASAESSAMQLAASIDKFDSAVV